MRLSFDRYGIISSHKILKWQNWFDVCKIWACVYFCKPSYLTFCFFIVIFGHLLLCLNTTNDISAIKNNTSQSGSLQSLLLFKKYIITGQKKSCVLKKMQVNNMWRDQCNWCNLQKETSQTIKPSTDDKAEVSIFRKPTYSNKKYFIHGIYLK